ncbi:MAG: glycine/sarcosine/betaine reductase component B subunit, partial [Wohlfahrtiimonas sp.]
MGVDKSILTLDKKSLVEYIQGLDARITEVELDIVKPGDSVRIMPVKDVIEPRVKVAGNGCIFPGFNPGEEAMVGEGKTHVLKGVAVVTTGHVVGFQEGIIDMAGLGAQYTPFSKTMNLVVRVEVNEHCKSNQYQHEAVLRKVGQAVARWIGALGKEVKPDETQSFETLPLPQQLQQHANLPKVGYVYMLQSQGLLHDTY